MRNPIAALLLTACSPAQDPAQAAAEEAKVFADPSRPRVNKLEPLAPGEAKTYPELSVAATATALSLEAISEDWPGFLGPRRDSKSIETRLLADWPEQGPKLLWSMRRGQGYSSPAIQGDHLVYTHRQGSSIHIDCLQAETGKRFWRYTYPCDYRGMYLSDGGPRATPQIEGDRVWVLGVEARLFCLELSSGRIVWERDLGAEFNLPEQFFGVVTSPLLYGEELIINLGAPGGPTVAAFDKNDGRMLWGTGQEWGMSCASPILTEFQGEERLLVLTGGISRPPSGGLMLIDPKKHVTLARFPFRSRTYESVNGTSPILVDDTVLLTSAYSTGSIGVRITADDKLEQSWKARRLGVEFSAALELDGNLYLIDGIRDRGGAIVCLDPLSGEELSRTDLEWEETVNIRGEDREMGFGVGTGLLLHIGGDRFLCLSDNGHLLQLRCGPKGGEILNRVSLFRAGETWTPLVLSRGLLYVCQNKREKIGDAPPRLLCYDLRGR